MFIKMLAVGLFVVVSPPVISQETVPLETSENTQVFKRSFFDQYNPQTARDMIDRLPGFTLNLGNDLRGFGATAGNILINGSRPLSKSGGIEAALERISAQGVSRVELIRGTSGNNETGDQSIIANIILKSNGSSGFWRASLTRNSNGQLSSSANVSYATQLGAWKVSSRFLVSLNRYPFSAGGNRISRDENQNLTSYQTERIPLNSENYILFADASRPVAGGTLKITSRLSSRPLIQTTIRRGFVGRLPDDSPDDLSQIELERRFKDGELGAEWAADIDNGWTVKLLSLLTYEDFERTQDFRLERPVGEFSTASLFDSDQEELESVLRATAQKKTKKVTFETGGEFAYNRLKSNLILERTTQAGTQFVTLPAANVTVSEYRGEAFAKMTWRLTDKLTTEAGLTVEQSKIRVRGDASSSRSFTYLKPSVALSYDFQPNLQLRLKARRSVGQLDFSDFAASASAADDRLTAGNPDLGPDQTTNVSFAIDYRTKDKFAFNVEAFHEWRENILEELTLPSGGSGIANAGSGRHWGIRANGSFPLDFVLPGGLLEVKSEFIDSKFIDPVTNSSRQISGTDTPMISLDFRQDFSEAKWSWGVSYTAPFDGTFYFIGEESFNRDSRDWSAFVETTRFFGSKINLELSNIGGQNFLRERRFFSPDRGGDFTGTQEINSKTNSSLILTISKQF